MKKVKRIFRILMFIGLILLATAGLGIPIPMYYRDRFAASKFYQEQVDEEKENEELEN